MLNLFLAFLRIRTLIILGIIYSFLSVASHGNFSLKIPDLKNLDLSNIPASINSLTNQEKKTMNIAKDHLGTSFNILKSIGFIKWNEKRIKNM